MYEDKLIGTQDDEGFALQMENWNDFWQKAGHIFDVISLCPFCLEDKTKSFTKIVNPYGIRW